MKYPSLSVVDLKSITIFVLSSNGENKTLKNKTGSKRFECAPVARSFQLILCQCIYNIRYDGLMVFYDYSTSFTEAKHIQCLFIFILLRTQTQMCVFTALHSAFGCELSFDYACFRSIKKMYMIGAL